MKRSLFQCIYIQDNDVLSADSFANDFHELNADTIQFTIRSYSSTFCKSVKLVDTRVHNAIYGYSSFKLCITGPRDHQKVSWY